jgi:heme o synthase
MRKVDFAEGAMLISCFVIFDVVCVLEKNGIVGEGAACNSVQKRRFTTSSRIQNRCPLVVTMFLKLYFEMSNQDSSVSSEIKVGANHTVWSDLTVLFKMRLSSLVIFSSVVAYFGASGVLDPIRLFFLVAGGALVTWASAALNHVLEVQTDLLMSRTQDRPVARGRISPASAVLMAGILALVGMTFLSLINPLAGLLGTLSFILYAFVYTPLKPVSQISVLVGAIPGALPTAIGAVAATGEINEFVVFIFLMQFFWQFPHFWGIAWVADEDYKKAGFKMLPGIDGAKDIWTGLLSFFFCLCLLVLGYFGYENGLLGNMGFGVFSLLNLYYGYTALQHTRIGTDATARTMMFASFFYLPIVLMVILFDQIW